MSDVNYSLVVCSEYHRYNDSEFIITTHDGFFHADEIVACGLYGYLHGQYRVTVVRSRDPETFAMANAVIDVGGMYQPDHRRYDHHMKEGVPTYGACYATTDPQLAYIRLASAGMIWYHHGQDILRRLDCPQHLLDKVHAELAMKVFAPVDAVDNGQLDLVGNTMQMTLSQILSGYNESFEEGMSTKEWNFAQNAAFKEACRWITGYLLKQMTDTITRIVKQNELQTLLDANIAQQNPILVMEKALPWKELLIQQWDSTQHIKLVIYQHPSGKWYIQTTTLDKQDPMSMRCSAPERIRGLDPVALSSATGIPGLVFVHPTRFLGGAETKEQAIRFAEWWITYSL